MPAAEISESLTEDQLTEIFEGSEEGDASKIIDLFLFSAEISNPDTKKTFLARVVATYAEYASSQHKRITELEITSDGASILHFAAASGGAAAIEAFLPHINLHKIDTLLASEILVMAATNGWDDALQSLLSRRDLGTPDPFLFHTNPAVFANLNTTLLLAVGHNQRDCVVTLLRSGIRPDVDSTVFAFSSAEIIYDLLAAGTDVDKVDENGFNFFDHLAIRIESENDEAKKSALKEIYRNALAKSKVQKDTGDIEKKIEISINKWLAKLLYSENEAPLRDVANLAQIILDHAEKLGLKEDDIFTGILQTVSEKRIFTAHESNHKFQISESALQNHASYWLIEYGEDAAGKKIPLFAYYVDGNCVFSKDKERGFGVTKLKVQESLEFDDLVGRLGKITSEKQLKAEVAKGEIFNPQPIEFLVETAIQKRGNCAMKSLLLLVELMGVLAHGKTQAQEWHEERKAFKHDMIAAVFNVMKEFAKEGYPEAKGVVAEMKENAKKKWQANHDDELSAKILGKRPTTSTRTRAGSAAAQTPTCCVIS